MCTPMQRRRGNGGSVRLIVSGVGRESQSCSGRVCSIAPSIGWRAVYNVWLWCRNLHCSISKWSSAMALLPCVYALRGTLSVGWTGRLRSMSGCNSAFIRGHCGGRIPLLNELVTSRYSVLMKRCANSNSRVYWRLK